MSIWVGRLNSPVGACRHWLPHHVSRCGARHSVTACASASGVFSARAGLGPSVLVPRLRLLYILVRSICGHAGGQARLPNDLGSPLHTHGRKWQVHTHTRTKRRVFLTIHRNGMCIYIDKKMCNAIGLGLKLCMLHVSFFLALTSISNRELATFDRDKLNSLPLFGLGLWAVCLTPYSVCILLDTTSMPMHDGAYAWRHPPPRDLQSAALLLALA